jgi:hypothetical protein
LLPHNAINSTEKYQIEVDFVEKNNTTRAIITYYDPRLRLSTFCDEQLKDDDGNYLYIKDVIGGVRTATIDSKHLENKATGFIVFKDGEMMLQPLIFKNDKFTDAEFLGYERDVTSDIAKPFQLDEGTEALVIDMLEEMGVGINYK